MGPRGLRRRSPWAHILSGEVAVTMGCKLFLMEHIENYCRNTLLNLSLHDQVGHYGGVQHPPPKFSSFPVCRLIPAMESNSSQLSFGERKQQQELCWIGWDWKAGQHQADQTYHTEQCLTRKATSSQCLRYTTQRSTSAWDVPTLMFFMGSI